MSRWFRHYAGMMRDEKLVSAAIRSKQSVERVVWVWGAILESAAEVNDDGLFRLDCAEAAYFLRADEADIRAIVVALTDAGRLASDRVVKWGDRQFKSDTSAERQARYRERRRGDVGNADDQQPSGDGGVTVASRHGDAPETETHTETEEKPKPTVSSKSPRGSRWQKGQAVPDEWKAWAKASFPSVEAYRLSTETRKFENHYPAAPGKDGVRSDWEGTYRNWMMRAFPDAFVDSTGPPADELIVLRPDEPAFQAVQRLRKSPIIVGNSGVATFTKAEVERATAA